MAEHGDSAGRTNPGAVPEERDGQRALDAASSEPRTLAQDERKDRATKLDEQATADQTAARRTDPSEDRALG